MLFNSFDFLIFFPLVTAVYFLTPHGLRWAVLLAASCVFYAAFIPVYILVLFLLIAVTYTAGILIEASQGSEKKRWLFACLAADIGILGFFKYYNFLTVNLKNAADIIGWNYPLPVLNIILPIGLSFHTFQAMGYTIEVYRGRQKAERHLGIYALYVMFYPLLVAGPIERAQNLLHQFYEKHFWEEKRVFRGVQRMIWGFFKKAVIADRLAIAVNRVYADPMLSDGPVLVLATVLFAYQIYCDFSGYSDIAIGSAEVMGFQIRANFRQPYASRSVGEFWTRWHISLSSWFRDYLYIPLGGNRKGEARRYLNLMITFLVSGLWHGAGWNYVFWGFLNGFYVLASGVTAELRANVAAALRTDRHPGIYSGFKIICTFSLISFAWIFFRADSFSEAWGIVLRLPFGWDKMFHWTDVSRWLSRDSIGLDNRTFGMAILAVIFMESVHAAQQRYALRERLGVCPRFVRWGACYAAILTIVFGGVFTHAPFIYFQF